MRRLLLVALVVGVALLMAAPAATAGPGHAAAPVASHHSTLATPAARPSAVLYPRSDITCIGNLLNYSSPVCSPYPVRNTLGFYSQNGEYNGLFTGNGNGLALAIDVNTSAGTDATNAQVLPTWTWDGAHWTNVTVTYPMPLALRQDLLSTGGFFTSGSGMIWNGSAFLLVGPDSASGWDDQTFAFTPGSGWSSLTAAHVFVTERSGSLSVTLTVTAGDTLVAATQGAATVSDGVNTWSSIASDPTVGMSFWNATASTSGSDTITASASNGLWAVELGPGALGRTLATGFDFSSPLTLSSLPVNSTILTASLGLTPTCPSSGGRAWAFVPCVTTGSFKFDGFAQNATAGHDPTVGLNHSYNASGHYYNGWIEVPAPSPRPLPLAVLSCSGLAGLVNDPHLGHVYALIQDCFAGYNTSWAWYYWNGHAWVNDTAASGIDSVGLGGGTPYPVLAYDASSSGVIALNYQAINATETWLTFKFGASGTWTNVTVLRKPQVFPSPWYADPMGVSVNGGALFVGNNNSVSAGKQHAFMWTYKNATWSNLSTTIHNPPPCGIDLSSNGFMPESSGLAAMSATAVAEYGGGYNGVIRGTGPTWGNATCQTPRNDIPTDLETIAWGPQGTPPPPHRDPPPPRNQTGNTSTSCTGSTWAVLSWSNGPPPVNETLVNVTVWVWAGPTDRSPLFEVLSAGAVSSVRITGLACNTVYTFQVQDWYSGGEPGPKSGILSFVTGVQGAGAVYAPSSGWLSFTWLWLLLLLVLLLLAVFFYAYSRSRAANQRGGRQR